MLEKIGQTPIRVCNYCGTSAYTTQELKYFVKQVGSLYGYRNTCKNCESKRNPIRKAIKYKVSSSFYSVAMKTSTFCVICGSYNDLCYDHDHSTDKFRGVLCKKCNCGIGLLGDTSELVYKAYMYLKKSENNNGE